MLSFHVAAEEAERLQAWAERLGPGSKVGLVWQGHRLHRNDRNRSLALSRLDPVLTAKASFVSVQRELRDVDREALQRNTGLTHVGDELTDFADTAAVLALVDLVICVDTSVGHLAGAMGRPTWILLPFAPDWRWLLGRQDSPWYPTVRLFRQPAVGDWDSLMAQARSELTRAG